MAKRGNVVVEKIRLKNVSENDVCNWGRRVITCETFRGNQFIFFQELLSPINLAAAVSELLFLLGKRRCGGK